MGLTVSQEMPDKERRERLMKGLRATGAEEVTVDFSHLAQAVGMNKAEKLVIALAGTEELVTSAMSKTVRMKKTGICSIDRAAALKACEDAQTDEEKQAIEKKADIPTPQKKAVEAALKGQ